MHGILIRRATLLAALIAALGAANAQAAAPAPCSPASVIADPEGDSTSTPIGPGAVTELARQDAPDNMDLTGVYLTADADGAVWANLRLEEASLAMPTQSATLGAIGGISYQFHYATPEQGRSWIGAWIRQDPTSADFHPLEGRIEYRQGVQGADLPGGVGAFHAGPGGVVSLRLPGVAPGDVLTEVVAEVGGHMAMVTAGESRVTPGTGATDEAPDGAGAGGGVTYAVPTCA